MLIPSESGVQAQLLEVMRMLLDSETIDTVSPSLLYGLCVYPPFWFNLTTLLYNQ